MFEQLVKWGARMTPLKDALSLPVYLVFSVYWINLAELWEVIYVFAE